jgi:ribosomal protein L11 methyltransferase
MPWLQLRLIIDREHSALTEAALENAGALAVTLDDAADDPLASPVLEPAPDATPLWRRLRLTALFDDDDQGRSRAEAAAAALTAHALEPPRITRLDDRPWERLWLDGIAPQRFGRRLWVCPRGQRVDAADAADAVVVDLDPGLAFGTGHHPTTALCLRWLDAADLVGRRVLDFGCGSGLLAIAALKLGAASAVAVDHDPQALQATSDNAADNGLAGQVTTLSPEQLEGEADRTSAFDIVVANILAGPLIELAPTLTAHTAAGGLLALSGLLDHQAEQVAAAYRDAFILEPPETLEDWVLLHGRRSG